MFVVAIYGWKEETSELAQSLAGFLGVIAFEVRQRLIGGGPSVIASFSDLQQAKELAGKINRIGIDAIIVDAAAEHMRSEFFIASRFEFTGSGLQIESHNDRQEMLPYADVNLLLLGTNVFSNRKTKKVEEKQFDINRAAFTHGLVRTKTVYREKEVSSEQSEQVLYLFARGRLPVVFSLNGTSYDGFGAEMKSSRILNFSHLVSQLRLHAPGATFDDRLLNKFNQTRLLGSTLGPAATLDLAAVILSRFLLGKQSSSQGE